MKVKNNSVSRRNTDSSLEKQLDRCCDQMMMLHCRALQMRSRYKKARKLGQTSSATSFKLQMEVFMRMYNLYHRSASRRAMLMEQLAFV